MLPDLDPYTTALGTPGAMRDRLVAAVLAGDKTAATCLAVLYHVTGQPPEPGQRSVLVGSRGEELATLEYTAVTTVPLGEIDLAVAHAEGEGFATVADWRRVHVEFWNRWRDDVRQALGDPSWEITDDEPVVVEYFRVVDRVVDASGPGE